MFDQIFNQMLGHQRYCIRAISLGFAILFNVLNSLLYAFELKDTPTICKKRGKSKFLVIMDYLSL